MRRCRSKSGLCLALCAALAAASCQNGVVYDAASLPQEFRVGPTATVDRINLNRLAAPSASQRLIGQGDLLELMVATGYESNRVQTVLVRVDDQGAINVPLIGQVAVGGLDPAEAEANVAAMAVDRGVYRQPYVTLTIKRKRENRITVVGAVDEPGVYELAAGGSDLLGALAAAGGLSEDAGLEVEVLRKGHPDEPGPQLPPSSDSIAGAALTGYAHPAAEPPAPAVLRVNLAEVSPQAEADYHLNDGDVVMVFPQEPRFVHVLGLVRKPDQFKIPPGKDLHLLDALALAGGRTMQLADKVRIMRHLDGEPPVVIDASVREAKTNAAANVRLAPGDVVSVEETTGTFVMDMLRSFMRFGFSISSPVF